VKRNKSLQEFGQDCLKTKVTRLMLEKCS